MDAATNAINQTFFEYKDLFYKISLDIWNHPELRFEEFHAHQLLTDHLEKFGFKTEKSYILETGFKANFFSKRKGPVIAIICEYDALLELGHACGHNLIASAGFAAAVAVKAALEADDSLGGTIVVLGTPAEEGGGGKIHFIKAGTFNNVDVAMMVHPARSNIVFRSIKACQTMTAVFEGKSSHASASPWLAKNALDAAVNTYVSVGLLRQQIHPECRIGVIISEGGKAHNIIPSKAEMQFGIRATNMPELNELINKVKSCCNSGAAATSCIVNCVEEDNDPYDSFLFNIPLGLQFMKHANKLGIKFQEYSNDNETASTDMGNVSQVVPSIHPIYKIGDATNHSPDFTKIARTEEAQNATMEVAKIMALTCIDIFRDQKLLEDIKMYFYENMRKN